MATYTIPNSTLSFPVSDQAFLKHYIRLGLIEFRDRTTFDYNAGPADFNARPATEHTLGSIILPMPDSVQMAYGPTWDFVDLDFAGFFLHGGAKKVGESLDRIKNAGTVSEAIGVLADNPLVKQIVNETARGLGVDETADAISVGFKKAFNPFKEAVFRGVANRTFAFSWNLFPRNQTECDRILEILKALKYHSSPALSANTVLFDYPGEFTIDFLNNGEINQYVPKIGYCVCSGIETNYTSAGVWAALKNGHPVDINLALAFTETTIVTKDKVAEGY